MNNGRKSRFLFGATCFGIAFLYVPMILLVFYSFNKSRIVPVWGGFSTKWYGVLFESEEVWEAIVLSLKIATVNATFAMILGTLAGLALVRFGRFKGRTLFSGMISAPLVMPEVITGLSLLLLFITLKEFIGWPDQRGFTTITIAHITFSMAYVAVVVQSRLAMISSGCKFFRCCAETSEVIMLAFSCSTISCDTSCSSIHSRVQAGLVTF